MKHDDLFEGTLHKTEEWLTDVMVELGTTDRHAAYRALRAVLHAIRDRLSVDEAALLAAQMPMLVRGMYYEAWRPAGKPRRIRSESAFVAAVRAHHGRGHLDVARAIPAVLRVLDRHTTGSEVAAVRHLFPRSLEPLLAGAGGSAAR